LSASRSSRWCSTPCGSKQIDLVLTFDAAAITAWIDAPDRLAFLTARHTQAVVGQR